MRCLGSFFVIAAVLVGLTVSASADDTANAASVGPISGVDQLPGFVTINTGGLVPEPLQSGLGLAKLYENTSVCTVNTQNIAVGGSLVFSPALSVRDWFTTNGGLVAGWELLLTNCGPEAVENTMPDFSFYTGTNAFGLGDLICDAENCAFFDATIAPSLPLIPVRCDAVTGEPHVIRVSVDYLSNTYTIEDVNDGVVLEHVSNIGSAFFGRSPFRLPVGRVGVQLRLGSERSICAGGSPVAGPVLASGGSGNEDGMYIIGASQTCAPSFSLLCNDAGWDHQIPCTGGDVCSLDRPFYGMALTLFMGPAEQEGGNNDISTADPISVSFPDPCTGGLSEPLPGFVGDNTEIVACAQDGFFDGNSDGELDLLDWGGLQACFGSPVSKDCCIYDQNQDGSVDLDDFRWFNLCEGNPEHFQCSGVQTDAAVTLADVDIYSIAVGTNQVVSIFVEGSKSPVAGSVWDPYLRVFWDEGDGNGLMERGVSDDYERQSLDAFTTVEIPITGVVGNVIYAGVSSASNANYLPDDPSTITPVPPDDAGGYTISVAITNPDCVEDDESGGPFDCYPSDHEPDDTLADAAARGGLEPIFIYGVIGDGAFAELGQDVDIYQIRVDGTFFSYPADAKRITARVQGLAGQGFETVFDLALALYDSDGELISTADQHSTVGQSQNDQSRPSLGANICGSGIANCPSNESPDPGIYYLAVFGTDRGLFDSVCSPAGIFPAIPPTLLNFPHGVNVAGTEDSDLRPLVAGRVNLPGPSLQGCEANPGKNPPPALQCYRIDVLTNQNSLFFQGASDPCDMNSPADPDGDDWLIDACDAVITQDRLSMNGEEAQEFHLGNGPYGGIQGDVDFYQIPASPGQIIAVNIADTQQPPFQDHPVRSHLGMYVWDQVAGGPCDGDDVVVRFADHDYSLERLNESMVDGLSDEIAATIATTMPFGFGNTAYLAVSIDNGNFLVGEDSPIDACHAGTTLSRRFETNIWVAREYDLAVAVMDPIAEGGVDERMFVVPLRGVDDRHVDCFMGGDSDGDPQCYPPILELDPSTGRTIKIINGASPVFFFSTFRHGWLDIPSEQRLTAQPLIAYDGSMLYVSVEVCAGVNCVDSTNALFVVDPDLLPGDQDFIENRGEVDGAFDAVYSGMAEIDGTHLYILDTLNNRLEYWDKTMDPTAAAISTTIDLTDLISGTPDCDKAEFDDIDGDLGTDGSKIYVACTCEGDSQGICIFDPDPETGLVTFEGIIDDPITNEELFPGPRLGGLDVIDGDVIVASDRNGPIIQHWDQSSGAVSAIELPREFLVARLTMRVPSNPD